MTDEGCRQAGDQTSLGAIAHSSLDLALALRSLARDLEISQPAQQVHPTQQGGGAKRRRGRPSRAEMAQGELLALAPFPELVVEPADRLGRVIRKITDVAVLRDAHSFELDRDRRKSVLDRLEERLRILGAPLGGPAEPPFTDFAGLSEQEIVARVADCDPALAAHIYAFEYYRGKREQILQTAMAAAGERAEKLVQETSPRAKVANLSEPFPGYDSLNASSQARKDVRLALRSRSPEELTRALDYEQRTKHRISLLTAIEAALKEKGT